MSTVLNAGLPGRWGSLSVADIDGDGQPELLAANGSGPNRALKWVGGQLRDVTWPLFADSDRATRAILAADVDGDGNEELLLANSEETGGDRLLKRGADGQWFDLLAKPENAALRGWGSYGLAALDRRGTGRYGFFQTHLTLPPRFLEIGPDGVLVDRGRSLGFTRLVPAGGVLAAPLFGAGTDLFCNVETGANAIYRALGDGAFEEVAERLGLFEPAESGRGLTALDASGDGRLDLALGHADGPHQLLHRQPDGSWRDRATPALSFPSALTSMLAADFDNDGAEELLLANRAESNRLFRIGPDVTLVEASDASCAETPTTGAVAIDFDGDGVLELVLANDPGTLAVFKPRGTAGNAWLRIQPLTRFHAPARGAVVRAFADGRTLTRVIDGGSGYRCQGAPAAHFGFGRKSNVEWVSVTWPDGASLALPNPDVNCTYRVPYPRG